MTRNPIRRSGLVLLSLLLPLSPLSAEDEKDLRELLRDALYTEEVTRDPEAAAKQYEALLSQHDTQRAFAASALFRLAEVRRKQDRKDEAIALYQKFLTRFPEADTEAKLAQEGLAALGGKLPSPDTPVTDPSAGRIQYLRKIAETSPDQLQEKFLGEVTSGDPKVVEFLISQGVDPKTPKALMIAAESGNLAICKILLQHGKPSPGEAGDALAMAASTDRSAVLSYLLDQGLDPNSPASWTNGVVVSPLMAAIEGGKATAAKTLIDRGADIDFMVQSEGYPVSAIPFASALHHVVWSRNMAMFKLLLEWGAKPDLPSPKAGITPLHLAANDPVVGETIVKELLARGADPNRKTTLPPPDTRKPNQAPREFALVTPFEIALGNESGAAMVEAMLAKGANANLLNRDGETLLTDAVQGKKKERLKLLIKVHADPDIPNSKGWTPLMFAAQSNDQEAVRLFLDAGADPNKGHDGATPLSLATNSGGAWSTVELLFAKGAKPEATTFKKALGLSEWDFALKLLEKGAPLPAPVSSEPDWASPLVTAAKSADALPLIEKMIAMGVKPDEGWIKSGFSRGYYMGIPHEIARPVRSFLFRRFVLPTLEESPGIRVAIDDADYMRVGMLDDLSGDLAPRPLAQSLLDPAEAFNPNWRIISDDRLTVWRRSSDGWTSVAERSFRADDDFPVLQRGDLIEVIAGSDAERFRNFETGEGVFDANLRWKLRQRVSFPVTLEIDGKVEEIKMRGDRLIHDPTSTDLPWCSAGTLARLRWKPEWSIDTQAGMSVVVIRKNWPEVRLPFPSDEASKFSLKAGDQVKLKTPPQAIDAMAAMRKKSIGFRAAGLPYGGMIECAGGNNLAQNGRSFPPPLIPSMVPSLCQLITETQVVPTAWMELSELSPEMVPVRFPASASPTTLLPHPDWSRIRILRLKEDGSEEVIEVNLARVINETNENASADEVKKHDVQLQPGDIVELHVHEDRLGQPWKGLSSKEERFLAKATEGKVQVIGGDAKTDLKEIRFVAPVFVETPAGWIPLPRKPGIQSVRASTLMGQRIRIEMTRNGETYDDVDPSLVFLRDGDQLKRQQPGGSTRPRPSVVPPPAR